MPDFMHQVKYDGVIVFLPKVDEIRPGDILLTFNSQSDDQKGTKQSSLIRKITKGSFSHALICSTPPVFVEAIGTGVSTLSLGRCFTHDISNVRLLRHPDFEIAHRAAQLVQDEIGRDYSVARAVRSVFPPDMLDQIDDHGTFCSALVAQAFTVAGSDIFRRTPVDKTTPATIENLHGLQDVTDTAFRSALAPNNIEEMSALDGDRAPTPSARQTAISAECARQIWPQANTLANAYPELELTPGPTFYALLRFVTDAIDRSARLPLHRQAEFMNALKIIDDAMASFLGRGDLQKILCEIGDLDNEVIMRNIKESFSEDADIDLEAMKAYLAAGQKQEAKRMESIKNWEEWDPTRSRAVSVYLSTDREVYEAIRRRNVALKEILERQGVRIA